VITLDRKALRSARAEDLVSHARLGVRLTGMSTSATTTAFTVIDSPIGPLTLVAENGALTGVYMESHRRRPAARTMGTRVDTGFTQAGEQLAEYFAGSRTAFELSLVARGDTFQRRVWELVSEIPYGETRSYGELARALGDPRLAQDVGAANARNPLCIIVPCHRVVGADGQLVGYAGGLGRKRRLLDLEERHGPGPRQTRLSVA
jgi:methylated-DNA-[protein]-cysteine S-methyltransferase